MTTIQLSELAGYLPYDLQVIRNSNIVDRLCGIMFSDDTDYNSGEKTYHNINHPLANLETHAVEFSDIKPLLVPLSEFNGSEAHKEINEVYSLDYENGAFNDYITDGFDYIWLPYCAIQILLKHHFDVHNLIGRGLALDKRDYIK